MCGIVGILSSDRVDQAVVRRMRDQLVHRGPDHGGDWRSDDGQVGLGHRRLAIIDLDAAANQPFLSADGRFAITFNGEIYNYRHLRRMLEEDGVVFRTQSDTEVLVEAYRAWDADCLLALSGMFAFAIWDSRERTLFCARDRAGEKPFHYVLQGGAFAFASELKALAAWPGFRREICYPALADYLTLGYVLDPKTIWQGCHKLPAASWLRVTLPPGKTPEIDGPHAYWDLLFEPDHGEKDWGGRIREALGNACSEMAVADVPIGTFLSGGVDSSSVTAGLARAGHDVTAFTVGFEEEGYDERPWARLATRHCGARHIERTVVADDVLAAMDKMLFHYDEPFNDYSYLPTYYVCREAREFITVALSGDGADELFAGYSKYQRIGMRAAMDRRVPALATSALAGAARTFMPASPLREKMGQYAGPPAQLPARLLQTGFQHSALEAVAEGPLAQTLAQYDPLDALEELARKAPAREVGLLNSMRYLDFKASLVGDMLVKVDRASMAVSLEVRPVYLHRDVIDVASRLPDSQLLDGNETKSGLKQALRPWLPDEILYRRKQGFAAPLLRWLEGDLGATFATGSEALDEIFPPRKRRELLARHAATGRDPAGAAHSLFFLGRWLERWA